MTVARALQLDVCYLRKASFVYVLLELFEFAFGAEEVAATLVKFGDLGRIEYECHLVVLK